MAKLADLQAATLEALHGNIKSAAHGASHYDRACQALVDTIYDAARESLALARVYATVPYGRLPGENRAFVDALARAKGVAPELRAHTPVLSLMGTRGSKPGWNDRRASQGHVGIPLVSANFVDAIPMIARLLADLGIDLSWVDRQEDGISSNAAAMGVGGVFYVEDAATVKDKLGRHVIPAQDFVAEQGVKSVFGAGVTYVDGMLAALILFTNESIGRAAAESFLPLMKTFKLATTVTAVSKGELFS